jgi:hypothetical protein
MADYCTTADVVELVSNVETWAQGISDKIVLATGEIDKYLRNVRKFTAAQIAGLTAQSILDLKTAAVYWTLFLCYNDASEGAAGEYAARAADYKTWFDREIGKLNLETTVTGGDLPDGKSWGSGTVTF